MRMHRITITINFNRRAAQAWRLRCGCAYVLRRALHSQIMLLLLQRSRVEFDSSSGKVERKPCDRGSLRPRRLNDGEIVIGQRRQVQVLQRLRSRAPRNMMGRGRRGGGVRWREKYARRRKGVNG